MHLFGKKKDGEPLRVSRGEFVAIIVATVALACVVGVARWSWLLMNEQISLRNDFEQLKNDQKQTEIQYEHWLDRIKKEEQLLGQDYAKLQSSSADGQAAATK